MHSFKTKHFLFFQLSFLIFHVRVNSFLLDPGALRDKLDTLARDGLGVQNMQNYINILQVDENIVNGVEVIQNLRNKLSNKFHARIQAAWRLKSAVEVSYASESVPGKNQECCRFDPSTLEYDTRFRTAVLTNAFCTRKAPGSISPREVRSVVKDTMESNFQNSTYIKWQYFGSKEGLTTIYPLHALSESDCRSYDNRFRPWYVATATAKPKNLVVVIDISGSMGSFYGGDTRLYLATEAAKSVLDTLNPRDKVGIVSFSSTANTPGSLQTSECYNQYLAQATSFNIANLKKYLAGLNPTGFTLYGSALISAFQLLSNSKPQPGEADRDQVILFLTDGMPTDSKAVIIKIIVDSNKLLGNKVIIMTYGIGSGDFSFLDSVAKQEGHGYTWDRSAGVVTPGKFIHITNIDRLRDEMAMYYDFFSVENQESVEPVIAVPYFDAWGLGLITTVTLPCYHNNTFIGVVGIDITMSDLLADVAYFGPGQESYAFLIDGSGRAMMHPLLQMPSNVLEEPKFIYIRHLEPEINSTIFDSMQRGESGQSSGLATKRFLPRGGTKAGVRVQEVDSTYYWSPVSGTNFSVGLVVVYEDRTCVLKSLIPHADFTFVYHRIDLLAPKSSCSQFNRFAVKYASVVKFSPEAFEDPYMYIGLPETSDVVVKYTMFMIDKTGAIGNPGFRNGVKDAVIASHKAEDIWLNTKTELSEYVVWRYIGGSRGSMRLIPGVVLDKSYDPTKRPWYHGAVANPGNNTLSTPYIDAFGAGAVITLSHVLYEGTRNDTFGVMGADFPLRYFHRLITDTYTRCKEIKYTCFMMDSSGFLVFHEDFLSPDITTETLEDVHITQKLRSVAWDLISKGILVKKHCRNFAQLGVQLFYEVHLSMKLSSLLSSKNCTRYEIYPIGKSNIYLGILEGSSKPCPSEVCECPPNSPCSTSPSSCKCPCLADLEFKYCENDFPTSSLPICPVPPVVVSATPITENTQGLEKCFESHCTKKKSYGECYGVAGCSWCLMDEQDYLLPAPYCTDQNLCYGGRRGNPIPGRNIPTDVPDNTEGETDNLWSMVTDIVGFSVGFVVFMAILFSCYNKLRSRQIRRSAIGLQGTVLQLTPVQYAPQVEQPPVYESSFGGPSGYSDQQSFNQQSGYHQGQPPNKYGPSLGEPSYNGPTGYAISSGYNAAPPPPPLRPIVPPPPNQYGPSLGEPSYNSPTGYAVSSGYNAAPPPPPLRPIVPPPPNQYGPSLGEPSYNSPTGYAVSSGYNAAPPPLPPIVPPHLSAPPLG